MANESDLITQIMGNIHNVDISMFGESFVIKTVESRCVFSGIQSISDYGKFLSDDNLEYINLCHDLHNTYTEFFRDSLAYAHLEQWLLPRIFEQKMNCSELRIWSAGCSTGQEPYSIAILLENLAALYKRNFRYRIIATDISESALTIARAGEYSYDAVQKIKVKDLKNYFINSGETYTISSQIRQHISFSHYNLLDEDISFPQESIYGNFDIIFCNNLLFYYNYKNQEYVINKLIKSLARHGYLITGETERYNVARCSSLLSIIPPSPIFQKKIEVNNET